MREVIKPKQRAADVLQSAMEAFTAKRALELMTSKRANEDVAGVLASALAGVCALGIKAGFGSVEEFEQATIAAFKRQLARDLATLRGTVKCASST